MIIDKLEINKKSKLIVGIFILCVAVCFITGCFSTINNTRQQSIKKSKMKVNYSRFVNTWNKQVYSLKDNLNSKFKNNSLEKYIIKNNIDDILKKLKIFLQFKDNYLQQLRKIKNLKFAEEFYLPVIMWINSRNKIKSINIDQKITQSELEKSVAKAIGDPYFSPNTIDQIIQLNEFCYYFEKNRGIFLKKGLSKSITKCEYIQKNLDKNKIELKLMELSKSY